MSDRNKNRRRKNAKLLYLSDNEIQMIKDRMERAHKDTFADYARHMLINGCIFVIDDSDKLRELTYELNKIGTNINQIAYIGNTTGYISKKDVETIKDMMFVIWGHVRQLLFGTPTKEQEAATEKICDMYAGILQDD